MDLKKEFDKKVVVLQEEMKALYASEKQKILSKLKQSFVEEVVETARKKAEAVADQELGIREYPTQQPDQKFDPEWSGQKSWPDPTPKQPILGSKSKNDAPAIIAMAQRKKRRPRVTKGFTPSEELGPMVLGLLVQHGALKKSRIADELFKQGVFNSVDLERHPDGKPRYYKTLDRVRKQMLKAGTIVTVGNGVWELAPVERIVEEV